MPKNTFTAELWQAFIDLLYQNWDLFATTYQDLPGTDLIQCEVDTGDAKPVMRPPYRYSEDAKREIERQCQELLDAGIIEISDSPWSSSVVLAKKKDGSYRMCVDLRSINKLVKPAYYPLPTLPQIFDTIA